MISVKLDASQALRRLREFGRAVGQYGDTRCEITPTHVVYLHCEAKGEALLYRIRHTTAAEVRARWRPKVEAVVKDGVKNHVDEAKAAKAWRYGAYVTAEKIWADVLRGSWGTVLPSTAAVKTSELRQAAARKPPPAEKRPPRPRKPRTGPRKPRTGPKADGVNSYGVRQRERQRRWYDIQKGKQTQGTRTEGDLTEREKLIKVFLRERLIGEA